MAETRGGQIRILVAADSVTSQPLARVIQEDAGCAVEVATDGRAAIEALESNPFDLVLMDCSRPVMDGFAATRSIRAGDSRVIDRGVPIIALTTLSMQDRQQRCLQAGMDDYLTMPVNPSELMETMERCLGRALNREPIVADHGMSQSARSAGSWLNPEILGSIIDMFFEDAPKQIAALHAALESGDHKELGAISHNLRGSSEFLGTNSISARASAVEKAARRGDAEQAIALAPGLVAEIERLLAELAGAGPDERT